MSRQIINEYRADLDRLRAVSGSRRESVLREAFKDLLKRWGRAHDLQFVPEHDIVTPQKNRIYLDGALLHALRVPFGYWEAKDADDDLDAEIAAKSRKGYPRDNIIYSDDHTAVLIQDGRESARVSMEDTDALFGLLTEFFAHERQEIADFNRAVRQFAQDLPAVLEALRALIAQKRSVSVSFSSAESAFLKHAQDAINPAVDEADVQEMLIQHILTEDIFAKVFDNPDFHRQNNVASELYKLENHLFARGEKSSLLRALAPYYSGISQAASVIQSHSEKQGFLKGLYENFYRVYNAKAADRLGVVYTPGEIVRFMIRSADWLCERNFGKNLIDRGVDILDPATGTGTYVVELLEHFRGNHEKLKHKYKAELHANEVAILPYYVANLNIEATYQAITGEFAEFENLCFVDTLDNVDALGINAGHQFDLLGTLTDENIERIKRQNRRKISVIIGNPPYNANQQSENDNNKNRTYSHVDSRIKNTYIKASTAQKTKLYDMYARFYRWASDRLGDEGMVAFITNRSFVDSRTFDGFRKLVTQDFQEIWIVDLGGDVRANPSLSGTKHNVFGIQTGVAIAFLVRKPGLSGCKIRYIRRPEDETADDKRSWLSTADLGEAAFTLLKPHADGRWLDTEDAEGWSAMLPLATSQAKHASNPRNQKAIFKLFSAGLKTNRDEWVFDRSRKYLLDKIEYFIDVLNDPSAETVLDLADRIKISSSLRLSRGKKKIDDAYVVGVASRPFDQKFYYSDADLSDRMTKNHVEMWGAKLGQANPTIAFRCVYSSDPLTALAVRGAFDYGLVKTGNGGTEGVARYRVTEDGDTVDNITDWALNKFVKRYGKRGVSKDTIFHYVYAILHDPIYREIYALDLKRDFPRIPFYEDFSLWAAWGATLAKLHIDYHDITPWPIERVDAPKRRAADTHAKPILKSLPEAGSIIIDADTQLTGIPAEVWSYKLGSRPAVDWILDQHREKKPRDPTIAARFNTYAFADHKEDMIELIAKVVRVSVQTLEITEAMRGIDRTVETNLP